MRTLTILLLILLALLIIFALQATQPLPPVIEPVPGEGWELFFEVFNL